jgi:hypothetical protein
LNALLSRGERAPNRLTVTASPTDAARHRPLPYITTSNIEAAHGDIALVDDKNI